MVGGQEEAAETIAESEECRGDRYPVGNVSLVPVYYAYIIA